MFAFSPSQKLFVREALLSNFRIDGRAVNQRRSVSIKCNILDNLAGSCYVSIDHGNTQIYTGIKLKVCNCNEGEKPVNQVILELSSMRKLNNQMTDCLSYLQQLLQQHFINKEVKGFTQHQILNSKKHFLEMHIQTFILCEPHLSLLESLFVSIQRAILSTSIPKLQCFLNEVTNEETVELTNQYTKLTLSAVETIVLVGCIEGIFVLDISPLQFESVDSVLLLAIKNERVQSIQSIKGSIGAEQIHKICRFALSNKLLS